jgi:hypothetical protein
MREAAVQAYELDYHDASDGFFFALGDEPWTFGPWSSDAQVLYCRVENEKLAHLVVIGGTQVTWRDQVLLRATAPSAFFEWRGQDAMMNAAPGGLAATAMFEELTGGAVSSAEKH